MSVFCVFDYITLVFSLNYVNICHNLIFDFYSSTNLHNTVPDLWSLTTPEIDLSQHLLLTSYDPWPWPLTTPDLDLSQCITDILKHLILTPHFDPNFMPLQLLVLTPNSTPDLLQDEHPEAAVMEGAAEEPSPEGGRSPGRRHLLGGLRQPTPRPT